MAAAMATSMAILSPKSFAATNPKTPNTSKPAKQIPLFPIQILTKSFSSSSSSSSSAAAQPTASVAAGAVFAAIAAADPAIAAQQLAEIANGGDSRGVALLIPLVPAVLWVMYNILQPALNQINRMRSAKGVVVGLGLGALTSSGFFSPPEASAGEITAVAEAAAADNRGQLLLFVVAPAIVWVLYNILQPALNQINRMRSD
ncbi:Photosystem II core complex proteins psbY-chloroplastic [Striga hermonthica]|uniref:Photosystem II core complex proteins psbY-chloroplastic n=1 Tax=Striga hermonthica TaxID=68872 RepID=A0A9N7R913_STRHE|nr:Photosystem II core complex proteins psbY-chloroplastic [Striga hermonthica]